MPFCVQCGNQVGATDVYCSRCGTRQSVAPEAGPAGPDLLSGISPRTASMLCYIPLLGWLGAIVILATNRFRQDRVVRFHAFQGLYLFVAWLIVDWFLAPAFHTTPGFGFPRSLPGLFRFIIFGTWIWMLIKTNQDVLYRLPILGELAEKSVADQA